MSEDAADRLRARAAARTPWAASSGRSSTLERDRAEQYAQLGERLTHVEPPPGRAARRRPPRWRAPSTPPPCAAPGARCSCAGCSSTRACWRAATSTSRSRRSAATTAAVRPDVVVRLPGDKCLVVDAKAPMTALPRRAGRRDRRRPSATGCSPTHATALRSHVDALAAKAYWSAFTTHARDGRLLRARRRDPRGGAVRRPRRCSSTRCRARSCSPPRAPCWPCCARSRSPGSRTRSTSSARELLELGRDAVRPARHARRPRDEAGRSAAAVGRGLQRAGRHAGVAGARHRPPDARPRAGRERDPRGPADRAAPRPLTRGELIDALDADVARRQLSSSRRWAGRTGRESPARRHPPQCLTRRQAPVSAPHRQPPTAVSAASSESGRTRRRGAPCRRPRPCGP